MLCQKCHKNEANIHISDGSDGSGETWHLCSSCAAEELAAKASATQLDLSKLLQILANHASTTAKSEKESENPPPRDVTLTCPGCGMTDVELEQNRRLGCAACYTVFRDTLSEWLTSLHRDTVHRGARPGTQAATAAAAQQGLDVDVLRLELERAIATEAYERAAELRDALRERLPKHTSNA